MIHIIRDHATSQEIKEMLDMLETYVKLAVDFERGILAGGGAMHADCEAVLLEDGSQMEILDSKIRDRVTEITVKLLGGI